MTKHFDLNNRSKSRSIFRFGPLQMFVQKSKCPFAIDAVPALKVFNFSFVAQSKLGI